MAEFIELELRIFIVLMLTGIIYRKLNISSRSEAAFLILKIYC